MAYQSGNGSPSAEPPGTVIGGYTIERVLGAGGMGVVYAARHPRLPRLDALKVLPVAVSDDPTYRARFEREADLAAGLDHPNIVPVYDRGSDDGRLWMSMKLIHGSDAAALLTANPHGLPVDQVIRIVTAVAGALDYAHGTGLQHRDVKPGNILIDDTATPPRIMLSDFGIARQQQEPSDLTSVGMVVGTLDYASPEQLGGDRVDGRSDQYSLAGTAVQLLTGNKPYGHSGTALIRDHLLAPPPVPTRARRDLPPAVDAVIARAMAKSPQNRYRTCVEFAAALQAATAALPQSGPPGWPPTAPSNQQPPATTPLPGYAQGSPSAPVFRPGSAPSHPGTTGAPLGYGAFAPAAPPRKRGRRAAIIGGSAAVAVVLAAAGTLAYVTSTSGKDSPETTPVSTSLSAPASTTEQLVNNTSTLRDGVIDPCLLPPATIAALGLSPLADDPRQRAANDVVYACNSSDSKAGNADVKFVTYRSADDWNLGGKVDIPDSTTTKWRRFTVPAVNPSEPSYCVTAYKSMTNGVLYVGLQKTANRDCNRGVEIAAAITPYLPQ